MQNNLFRFLGPILLLAMGGGCLSLQVPEMTPVDTPERPVWQTAELQAHLRVLYSEQVAGRRTGTPGGAQAAQYVGARMGDFRLQPVWASGYETSFTVSVNQPTGASMLAVGVDTLLFVLGGDMLPDGRTDGGAWQGREVLVWPAAPAAMAGQMVLLGEAHATTDRLLSMARSGARGALVVGPLVPVQAAQAIPGLMVVQVSAQALEPLFRLAPGGMSALLEAGGGRLLRMGHRLEVAVQAWSDPRAGGWNVLGYVPGKAPARLRELVIVCADLDALGLWAGVPTVDFSRPGWGVAAMLEVARVYGLLSRYWPLPSRTVLFAAWSGSREGHRGLQAFLQQPTWPLDQVHAMLYLGPRSDDLTQVSHLLAPYGIPLHAIAVPDTLSFPASVSFRQAATERRAGVAGTSPTSINQELLILRGIEAAQGMAQQAFEFLALHAIEPAIPAAPQTPDPRP